MAESFAPSSSSSAATVTLCAVFQFEVEKVRVPPAVTDRSVPDVPPTVTVTAAEGWAASFTV